MSAHVDVVPPRATPARRAQAAAIRILLVDDNLLILESQRLHLEKAGYRVTVASSADEALRSVRRQRPDLVLSDVLMPGTDGFHLCRALRRDASTSRVPVVLVSGNYGDSLDVRHAAHCGANMFVSRSGGQAAIAHAIRLALKHPETRLEPAEGPILNAEHDARISEQLNITKQKYRTIFNGIADGVFVTDADFSVVDANPAFLSISGYTLEEVLGKPVADFVPTQERPRLAEGLRGYIATGSYESDFPFRHKDGSARLGRFSGRRMRPDCYVNIIRDVTEQQRKEELLHLLAYTDSLTGLVNRTTFQDRLEHVVMEAVSGHCAAGVLLLSLRNFQEINDTLGPVGGDRVLCEVANRIKAAGLGTNIVNALLGTARFGVLLPRLDRAQPLEHSARALLDLMSAPILVDSIPVEVAVSIGAAQCPDDGLSGSELLRRASVALHHARDLFLPYARYSAELDPFSVRRLTLMSELRHAVECQQLELWYQPKLDLRSGRVDAVEALLRWRHPALGLIPPDDFIPAAERTGLVHAITAWVLKTALRQAKTWKDQGLRLNLAVNISMSNLREPNFFDQVVRELQLNSLAPGDITLEVTESAAMLDVTQTVQALGQLKRLGLRISLDDFGTGHASLAHLHRLPVDEIKLDKTFVQNLPDAHSLSIAAVTVILAREFGLKTVAEGVEGQENVRLLAELGFDQVQGYHVSEPLPVAELEAWIAARQPSLPADAAT